MKECARKDCFINDRVSKGLVGLIWRIRHRISFSTKLREQKNYKLQTKIIIFGLCKGGRCVCQGVQSMIKVKRVYENKTMRSLHKAWPAVIPASGGAELLRELELDLRDSELWLRDFGRSAAIAANSEMATGQNHSWCSPPWCWLWPTENRMPNALMWTGEKLIGWLLIFLVSCQFWLIKVIRIYIYINT